MMENEFVFGGIKIDFFRCLIAKWIKTLKTKRFFIADPSE